MWMEEGLPDFFDIFSWKLVLIVLAAFIIRAWLKGTQFKEKVTAKALVAVVTGANAGIGKQIVRELNLRGAKVYMLCRDKQRGLQGAAELVHLGCNSSRLIVKEMDLTRFASVRQCAKEIQQEEKKIDILINNAAVMLYPKFKLTEDGHETTWQTNYLGHFLLTELLLPLLKAAPSARIVNVSALAHFYSEPIDVSTVDRRERWDARQAYARSKLAQVMHARELTRRLRRDEASSVTINACHPGLCYTRIMRHTPLAITPLKYLAAPFAWYLLKTPKDGSQTPICVAISNKLNGVSGKYYSDCQEKACAEMAMDDDVCQTLYNSSLEACGLGEWDTVSDARED
uniref:Uncharacterized protein n=1 Tax=Plectus sambesii TaxID=2011161 RepID=A0A914WBS4_9BILA